MTGTDPIPVAAGGFLRRKAAVLTGAAVRILARLITAVQAEWRGIDPVGRGRVYYANHASHGDFILIWSVLPSCHRARTRPVAGADYWGGGGLRGFVGRDVFNAVLIDRQRSSRAADPIRAMGDALDDAEALILFPEGTRNLTDQTLLPFKSGLFHLARSRPDIDMVPVWIENLNRVMPKGEIVPVPLMCKVIFGAPIRLAPGEGKEGFLTRARDALLGLRPDWPEGER